MILNQSSQAEGENSKYMHLQSIGISKTHQNDNSIQRCFNAISRSQALLCCELQHQLLEYINNYTIVVVFFLCLHNMLDLCSSLYYQMVDGMPDLEVETEMT